MTDMEIEREELFNVVQEFIDGSYEYVRRNVPAQEAVEAAKHYCTSVAAQQGFTRRVIITDDGDCCNFEWKFGIGITYPRRDEEGHFHG